VKRALKLLFERLGYDVVRLEPGESRTGFAPDFDDAAIELFRAVEPYTMTSRERVLALRQSVEYIIRHDIPGAMVECGVWKGGSMMAVAKTLMHLGTCDRMLHLFDTFEGMPEPGRDDRDYRGEAAVDLLTPTHRRRERVKAASSLDEVKSAMASTGYEATKTVFVKGKVEDTIPSNAPETIALLRLDTDWYESTYHELVHLYPRLSVGGVLILDDYGHWRGARKAVDQFIAERRLKLLLCRIDYTGRIAVKVER
jgi:hypothetical protein